MKIISAKNSILSLVLLSSAAVLATATNAPEQIQEPTVHQENIFNSLKGISALRLLYAERKDPNVMQRLAASTSTQSIQLDLKNAQEILAATADQTTKKLEEYEVYLANLAKRIDGSLNTESINVTSLASTLDKRWSEYNTAVLRYELPLKKAFYNALSTGLLMATAPGFARFIVTNDHNAKNALNVLTGIGFGMGVVLGLFQVAAESSDQANLETAEVDGPASVKKLFSQLARVVGAEELLNSALTRQKHKELYKHYYTLTLPAE